MKHFVELQVNKMVTFMLTPGKSQAAHSWLPACHTFLSLQLLLVFSNQANDKQLQVAETLRNRAALPSRSKIDHVGNCTRSQTSAFNKGSFQIFC